MKEENTDLRIKRTLFLIKNAFITLLAQKSFDEIHIMDICEKALVHRTTFYKHFKDKYDLVNSIIKDLEDNFIVNVKDERKFSNEREYYMFMLEKILDYIQENKALFKNVFAHNSDNAMNFMIIQAIERNTNKLLQESRSDTLPKLPVEITARFMSSGLTSVAIWWLLNDTCYTKAEMLKHFEYIVAKTAGE